jgi:hypothetical protein
MMEQMRKKLQRMTWEDWVVALFGASFLIGVWYALPMVNTVTDVWPFGGGVLRAMEARTLLPGDGVAYGTLSFYQNYIAMAVALCVGYVFSGFDIEVLKATLTLNPSYSLLVPRIVSALSAVALLVIVHRFLKIHVESIVWRLTLIVLAFGNVLTVIIARSGKMWMLSTALCVISFIYLYRAITEEGKTGMPGRNAAISIIAAFLAAANFSFAVVFLITIPILLLVFPRTRAVIWRLAYPTAIGGVVLVATFAANAENSVRLILEYAARIFGGSATSTIGGLPTLSIFQSFVLKARHTVESFLFLLLALIPALRTGVRDWLLVRLSLLYIALYMFAVSFAFRADYEYGLALNIRHILPVGFFLMFLLVGFRAPRNLVAVLLCIIGLIIYVYTLVLLSIPTTYNAAADFIADRYGDKAIRIDESIFELTLPMNKASYALYATSSCASTCQHVRMLQTDIAFRPLVVTKDSDPAQVAQLPPPDLVVVERSIEGCRPLARFGNETRDDEVFDIDINLGRMLVPAFYRLHNLGKNIYIYETENCAAAAMPTR